MKKHNFIFIILSIMLLLIGCSTSKNSGSFEGIGTGKHGEIKVMVSIKDAKITKIDGGYATRNSSHSKEV